MRKDLDQIIKAIRSGEAVGIGGMSNGERCYIALATGRYDLLPADTDPIEACTGCTGNGAAGWRNGGISR